MHRATLLALTLFTFMMPTQGFTDHLDSLYDSLARESIPMYQHLFDSAEAARAEAQKGLDELRPKLRQIDQELTLKKREYERLKAENETRKPGPQADSKAYLAYANGLQKLEAFHPQITKTQSDLDALRATYEQKRIGSLSPGQDVAALNNQRTKAAGEQKSRIEPLLKQLREDLKVNDEFSKLAAQGVKNEVKLMVLEREYDQSLMGAYVREKMGRLLNSGEFCKASAQCQSDGTRAKESKKIEPKGLFHDGNGKLGGESNSH